MEDLSKTDAKALSDAVGAIVAGPQPTRLVEQIEPEWLTPAFRLCNPSDEWRKLTLASPAVRGDLAFVYADYDCPLCGHGVFYALRRKGEKWEIVAEVLSWIS